MLQVNFKFSFQNSQRKVVNKRRESAGKQTARHVPGVGVLGAGHGLNSKRLWLTSRVDHDKPPPNIPAEWASISNSGAAVAKLGVVAGVEGELPEQTRTNEHKQLAAFMSRSRGVLPRIR